MILSLHIQLLFSCCATSGAEMTFISSSYLLERIMCSNFRDVFGCRLAPRHAAVCHAEAMMNCLGVCLAHELACATCQLIFAA